MTIEEINKGLADGDALSVLIDCDKYLPINMKINTAEMLLDVISKSISDETNDLEIDLLSHILIRIAFIQMYSDIDLSDEDESDCYEDYDSIMENGIFDYILNEVGKTEFEDFEAICKIVLESK